jgi:hypothetical protein
MRVANADSLTAIDCMKQYGESLDDMKEDQKFWKNETERARDSLTQASTRLESGKVSIFSVPLSSNDVDAAEQYQNLEDDNND